MYQYAFTMYPNCAAAMPGDAIAGGALMYGDPDDKNCPTHFVY